MGSFLELDEVEVRVGSFRLGPVTLKVQAGESFVLLGASGAGKTILLETIAGFHRPVAGRIRVGGREVTSLPPELRRVGLMFQDYALFPHKTVRENVEFALAFMPADSRKAAGELVERLLTVLGLVGLAERRPLNLSGGEKQRVALARALAASPDLLLLDEPLSALDERTRGALREELLAHLKSFGVTSVLVTHDRTEALRAADRLAIVEGGQILQVGPPEEVFYRPQSLAVAKFVGCENLLAGVIRDRTAVRDPGAGAAGDHTVTVELTDGAGNPAGMQMRAYSSNDRTAPNGTVVATFRAEDVVLAPPRPDEEHHQENTWPARVEAVSPLGALVRVEVRVSSPSGLGQCIASLHSRQVWRDLALVAGAPVMVSVVPQAVSVVSASA